MLIGVEGTKTPAGGRVQGRTRRRLAPEEAPGPPAESEVPGAEINSQFNRALIYIRP